MKKIYILFDSSDLNKFIVFLDSFVKQNIQQEEKRVIIGKTEDTFEILPYENILYFEANNNNISCKTINNKEYRIKEKLYELELRLDNREFFRINKSYIVNVLNITEIVPWFSGRLKLKFSATKSELEVSRNYSKTFKSFLGL